MHGLFGKLAPGEMNEFNSWKDVASQVYKLSKQKTNIYRGIISFTRETANELGLINQEDWQRYIETHMLTIANLNDIKVQNLCYACAVHDERHHPHIHIVFWDKEQAIMKNYIHKEIPNKIRKQLIKDTFEEKIKKYCEGKDSGKVKIGEITDEMVKDFEHYIKELHPKEYMEYKKLFETFDEESIISNPIYARFNKKSMNSLAERLFKLKNSMPKAGRLAYQLLPKEIKEEVDKFVAELINKNSALNQSVKLYVNSKMNMAKLYSSNNEYLESQKVKFQKEAEKIIANKVLGTIKLLIKKEGEFEKFQFTQEQKMYYAEQMLREMLSLFGRKIIASDMMTEDFSHKALSTELSKKAKKEYYLKNKDKGIEL